jgi:uncharacterized membrane protein
MDKIWIVLHIAGTVFVVGPMAILPMSAMRTLRTGSASQLVPLAKSTELFSILSIVVAVVGFPLMWSDRPDLSVTTPWILISVVLYAAAVLLSLFLVVPAMRRAAAEVKVTSPPTNTGPEGADEGYAAIATGSGIVSVLLVAVVVLMTWRP